MAEQIYTLFGLIFLTKNIIIIMNPVNELEESEEFSKTVSNYKKTGVLPAQYKNLFKKKTLFSISEFFPFIGLFIGEFIPCFLYLLFELILFITVFKKYDRLLVPPLNKGTKEYIGALWGRSFISVLFGIYTIINIQFLHIDLFQLIQNYL